ncbi:MAG: tRNA (adenosine(37)-N6)-threonylcarbamoyltransferase complex transferase subunit TsaD [Patescibacteria group bacterium]
MLILGIESSCDDTSVALVEANKNEIKILAEKTASQIEVHKKYGGVVPEIAGRKHAEKILPLIEAVMDGQNKPDVIAVTAGPGLMTGLLVGVTAAQTLSYLWNVPVTPINHIEGHIYSVLLDKKQGNNIRKSGLSVIRKEIIFPALCLIVSGGHTELILMKNHGKYELVGKTRDDAAGECFDKVAKLLGLDYPGGPQISKLAESGNPSAIPLPRPMLARRSPTRGEDELDNDSFDFSFSGLKTAALYWLRDNAKKQVTSYKLSRHSGIPLAAGQVTRQNDFCASFQQAIIDVLVAKTIRAAKKYNPKTIILAGGVSANKKLKETLKKEIERRLPLSSFLFPLSSYSMDNAAMIAMAGYIHAIKNDFTPWQQLTADPNWKIYQQSKAVV